MPAPNSTPPQFHELSLRVSKRLLWLFWIANGLALLAIFISGAPLWLQLGATAVLLVVGWRQWRREFAVDGAGRIVALRWRDNLFQVRLNRSELAWVDADLLPGSRYWPGWLVLRLDLEEGGRRQLILPADAGDKDTLRRLQLLLQRQETERSEH